MTTHTDERTSRASHTDLGVVAGSDGARACVRTVTTAHPDAAVLRPVLLGSGSSWARVALVAEGALLLAGDQVAISVDIGPGVHLTVIEPSGVVAYSMRGMSASWKLDIRQGPGSSLVWEGQPFVAAADAVVDRRTTAELSADARLLLRETLVLGRSEEPAGLIRSRSEVFRDASPVLVEELILAGATQVPGLLGGHRVLDSVLSLGHAPAAHPGRLDLDSGDQLYRELLTHTHDSALSAIWTNLERSQALVR